MTLKKHFLLTIASGLFFMGQAFCTTPTSTTTAAEAKPVSSDHAVYIGTGYGSDMMYDGSGTTSGQPYLSADISYSFRGKLWSALTLYNLTNKELLFPMADLSLGYNHEFNDLFDFSAAISSYFTALEVKQEMHENFSFLRMRLGYDWYWLYTSFTAGTILGQDQGWYLYLRNSRYFKSAPMGKSKSYLSFNPNVNLAFGKTVYYEDTYTTKSFPGRPPVINPQPITDETNDVSSAWNIMKLEFALPVSLNLKRATIEVEPVYFIPGNSQTNSTQSSGLYFFLNAYYKIF
jgi:hypothetical protein